MAALVALGLDTYQFLFGRQIQFSILKRKSGNQIKSFFPGFTIHMFHHRFGVSIKQVNVVVIEKVWIKCNPEQPILKPGEHFQLSEHRCFAVFRIPKMDFAIPLRPKNPAVLGDRKFHWVLEIILRLVVPVGVLI